MKSEVEIKLDKISDIWNHYIWRYKFCATKIKFNDDVKTNYFGSILGYFADTINLVFSPIQGTTYQEKFSFSISFLQAIYIHQDFIQELKEE